MEIYFNGKKCNSMKELQKEYQRWINKSEDDYFSLIVKDENNIILEQQFHKQKEKDIFTVMHSQLTQALQQNIANIFYSRNIEEQLDVVDMLYVLYYQEIHEEIELFIALDKNAYNDYLSDEETLIMAQRCAIYDIENDNLNTDVELLTQEYLNLSTEQLLEEYEMRYDDDFHITYINNMYSNITDTNMKRIISKSLSQYKLLKNYHLVNNISMEMRKRK